MQDEDHHLAPFTGEHMMPPSSSQRFKADFPRCLNTALCGSCDEASWSDLVVQLPARGVCFALHPPLCRTALVPVSMASQLQGSVILRATPK